MDESNQSRVRTWNAKYNDRQKLQHVYLLLAFISFVIAATTSLIDQSTGRAILVVAVVAGLIFVANAVIWSLLFTNLLVNIKPVSNRTRRGN